MMRREKRGVVWFLLGMVLLLSFNAKDYVFSVINAVVVVLVTVFAFLSLRKGSVKWLEFKALFWYCSLMILAFLTMVFVRKLT
jgi:hypothetical protein